MNKKLFAVMTLLLIAALLMLGASAADIYVKTGAMGNGESADFALGSLSKAIKALDGKGGTVYLCDTVTVAGDLTIPEQSGNLVITSADGMDGRLSLAGTVTLGKNENGNKFVFDAPVTTDADGIVFFGGFNTVHFTENFKVDGEVNFYGGVDAPAAATNNRDEIPLSLNEACVTDLPYSITVDEGNFAIFVGGNRRSTQHCVIGSIAAALDITINGGTFTKVVDYTPESGLKRAYPFSLSGMSLLAGDATLTITGGTFNTPIYLHGYLGWTVARTSAASKLTYSDAKYYAADGDVVFDISGGTFTDKCIEISAEATAASYNRLHRGNFTLNIGAGVSLADGIVLDATQVKAYSGKTEKATLVYNNTAVATPKRFDSVEGITQKAMDEPIRIACVGDSITEGVGTSTYTVTSYPAQLYTKALQAGKDVIVSNYGSSNAKVMDYNGQWYNTGLAYTLSMHETDADYIIVGLGTNDAVYTTYTYGFTHRYYNEYKELISGYAALPETDMVYGTSALHRTDAHDVATVCNIRGTQRKVLEELAAEGAKCTFVDLYALTLESALGGGFFNDTVHPTSAGYTVYANVIYNALFNKTYTVPGFELEHIYVSADGTGDGSSAAAATSNISIAFAKAKDGSTIHIMGEYKYNKLSNADYGFSTPAYLKDLTIVGEGEGAVLSIDGEHFFIKSDLTMDNITLTTSDTTSKYDPLHISCGYHNVTLGENFKTYAHTATTGGTALIAGVVSCQDILTSGWYNTREAVSFDNDCTITVNGGDYRYFIGGNYLYTDYSSSGAENIRNTKESLYGTYSGNMLLNIGSGVTVEDDMRNGAVGQNYLTGSVKMYVGAWADGGAIREYSWIGDVPETKSYNAAKNTGKVTIDLADGLNNPVIKAGDVDQDGTVDFADALLILKYAIIGTDANYNDDYYFDQTAFRMPDVLRALKKAVQ